MRFVPAEPEKSGLSGSSVQVAEAFGGTSQLLATIVVEEEWNP
jgi:hypothetical protein